MNEKQQQLTFDKGITNVPSDAICSDNALEECIGMVYDDGEHRVIQKPAEFMEETNSVLFKHDNRFIVITGSGSAYILKWRTKDSSTLTKVNNSSPASFSSLNIKVDAIGNTLIVKTSDSIWYYLWDTSTSGYKELGNILPDVELEFSLVSSAAFPAHPYSTSSTQDHGDCIKVDPTSSPIVVVSDQKTYNDLVLGLYAKNKKTIYRWRRFVNPFYIRYAYELYDGTYTHASAPVLMYPSVRCNSYAYYRNANIIKDITLYTASCTLQYNWENSCNANVLQPWKDIIKDIVVFITDEIDVYDTADDQKPTFYKTNPTDNDGKVWYDGVYGASEYSSYNTVNTYPDTTPATFFLPLSQRSENEIKDDLMTASVFYRLFSLGTLNKVLYSSAASRIDKYTLENITQQEQLPDDYYSHCPLSGESMITYNNRLILSNIIRGFYEGPAFMMPFRDSTKLYDWIIDVTIKTPQGDRTVTRQISEDGTHDAYIGYFYFFYPDPRASKAIFYRREHNSGSYLKVYERDLKEHSRLNGAFFFGNLPSGTPSVTGDGNRGTVTPPGTEIFANQIYVSEVNNPFVFNAEGNITIGNGDIIGLSSLTQALSEGQFGQYPLIIFTTDGIWAASTGNTGLFMAVHPMSREVALADNPCITQTDGAVFFASEKGLMVIVGNQVKCVSEQLSGKSDSPFVEFLRNAVIAYDYRDSLLWIMKPNESYAWVYSIKSGTFAHYRMATLIPQANVQQSPQLRMAPRRSASASATNPYSTWPVLPFANIENSITTFATVDTPLEVIYANPYDEFLLKGNNDNFGTVYQLRDWVFEGHPETDYNNGGDARTDTVFYNRANSHYYVFDAETEIFKDLGTTNPTTWNLSVDESSLNFAAGGEGKQIVITSNISWEIITSQVWVTASPASGSGSATITVTANQNQTTIARNATLTVRGTGVYAGVELIINISQDAGQVTPQLTVSKQTVGFGSSADSDSFNITSNTSWTISENSGGWLTVNNGTLSGSGNATIPIAVTASPTAYNRQATITITDGTLTRTIVVAQSGSGSYSSLSFSPYAPSFTASGGEIDATLTCDFTWNMVENSDWISISPSSGSGSGTGTIRITAERNRTASSRTATLELVGGGQAMTITVSQEAGTEPVLSVDPSSLSFAKEGEGKPFTITSDVSWTISAGDANWLSLSSNSGSGNATITVTAAANPGENQRSATLNISGEYSTSATVNITQSGNNPEPPIPTEYSVNVVNDYPDSLIQVDSKVYSLMERVNINNDNGTYSGTIITRPMKLENALALKSIMQIRHILQMDGTMTMQIFASNNLDNWVELHSLRGTPWKYYKFRFNFSDMKATDRFAGTMLITQERRTNKLR